MDIKKELEEAVQAQRNADRLEIEWIEAQKAAFKKVGVISKQLQKASKPLVFYECLFGEICSVTIVYSGSGQNYRIYIDKIKFLSQQTEDTSI